MATKVSSQQYLILFGGGAGGVGQRTGAGLWLTFFGSETRRPVFQSTTLDFALRSYLGSAGLSYPVFPLHVPRQVSLPAYTYQRIYSERPYRLSGQAGLNQARYQFTSWSLNYDDCVSMSESLRNVLQGYAGLMGGSVQVQMASLNNQFDSYDPAINASDRGAFARMDEYFITYVESYPST